MNGTLEIKVYSIDRGSAAWLSTPWGSNIMFDLGRGENFSPLADIYSRGVRTLDAVFISHPHLDHYNDIENLRYFGVGRFFRSDAVHPDMASCGAGVYSAYACKMLSDIYIQYHTTFPYQVGAFGTNQGRFVTNDGVSIDVFAPQGGFQDVNDFSLVSVVSYHGLKVVLFGDNGPKSIETLCGDTRFMQAIWGAQCMLAPHHGRVSGYSPMLGKCLSPELCLVSDGRAVLPNAVSAYDGLCRGKSVTVAGANQFRKCLTTRSDGHIQMTVNPALAAYGPYQVATFR